MKRRVKLFLDNRGVQKKDYTDQERYIRRWEMGNFILRIPIKSQLRNKKEIFYVVEVLKDQCMYIGRQK